MKKVKKTVSEQTRSINKEIKPTDNLKEILEVKSIIMEMQNSVVDLKADLSRHKKESANFKIGKWKVLSLRNRKGKD